MTNQPPDTINILGVPIHYVSMADTCAAIARFMGEPRLHQICTANPEFVMKAQDDASFQQVLQDADLCLADGIGLVLASKWRGRPLPERVPGSELVYHVAGLCAAHGWRLFLLGAAEGVAAEAADILKAGPSPTGYRWHLFRLTGRGRKRPPCRPHHPSPNRHTLCRLWGTQARQMDRPQSANPPNGAGGDRGGWLARLHHRQIDPRPTLGTKSRLRMAPSPHFRTVALAAYALFAPLCFALSFDPHGRSLRMQVIVKKYG